MCFFKEKSHIFAGTFFLLEIALEVLILGLLHHFSVQGSTAGLQAPMEPLGVTSAHP